MAVESIDEKIRYWQEVIICSAIFLILVIIVTVLRLLARWKSREARQCSWIASDDILVLPSLVAIIVVGVTWATCAQATIVGYNVNLDDGQRSETAVSAAKSEWIGSLLYPAACTFPKLSICALYLRIFTSSKTRTITWVVLWFLVTNMVAFTGASIFYCTPPQYYWESYAVKDVARVHLDKSKCINNYALTLASNPPNIVSDFVMIILPLPTVWAIFSGRARKIGLTVTFLTANLGMIGSIVRWAIYLATQSMTSIRIQTIQLILTLLEPTMYHAAACLPPTRNLFVSMTAFIESTRTFTVISTFTNTTFRKLSWSSSPPDSPQTPENENVKMWKGGKSESLTVERTQEVGVFEREENGERAYTICYAESMRRPGRASTQWVPLKDIEAN